MSLLLPLLAYLFGSISSAVVVSRAMGLQDPRTAGSRNPGATNVLRLGGKKAAVITLAGDILKGVIPVLIARALTDDPRLLAATAAAAFLGHLFPIFFGFKGGKGVATAWGALTALNAWVGLALILSWLVVALAFRYSSLAAISAAVLGPAYVWWFSREPVYFATALGICALLLWRHRGNIRNLVTGKEDKIGARRS